MQANTETFKLEAAPGNGGGMPVGRYTFKSVHLIPGTGSPDYDLEMSFDDGANGVPHTIGITTETVITPEDVTNPLPRAVSMLRFVTTVAGTGPSAVMFGHDPV